MVVDQNQHVSHATDFWHITTAKHRVWDFYRGIAQNSGRVTGPLHEPHPSHLGVLLVLVLEARVCEG